MFNKFRLVLFVLLLAVGLTACKWPGGGGGTTPAPCQTSGTAFVGLSQSSSYIFSGEAVDPLLFCAPNTAVISSVTNMSGRAISLAHGGPGSIFIILDAGQTVTAFNGLLVAGNWTAQVSGPVIGLPSGITLRVDWVR